LAALTPLISGAISKTVNLPKWATIEDFKEVVLSSWKLGVKGITLYRDSSKASQPLNTTLNGSDSLNNATYDALLNRVKELETKNHYSTREKPMGIRQGTTHPAQIDDVKIYTTVNRRADGEISEIYITTDREGTIITGLLNSLSKSISVMLQYHVPPVDIAKMLRGQKYEPYGFVQKHPYIKSVSSISDLVSKIIDIELGDYSRCQVKPGKEQFFRYASPKKNVPEHEGSERVYGSTCSHCSSTRMVRNGTCMVCMDCGSTTGCS
jgi:ribonucleoside-diphosphate reductase alpha chain